jgi:glyceraldehyde 3-phosphate dehydrogenase
MNNVVITSTTAAKALEQVMPEIATIGFMADSVRIPTASVSLIILNVTFQTEALPDGTVTVDRDEINTIYKEAAAGEARGLVKYSDEQNVSADILGEDAAVVIEGIETHTRTGFVDLKLPGGCGEHRIPLTHVKVFGWYDNEMGSYTHRLGELTAQVSRSM